MPEGDKPFVTIKNVIEIEIVKEKPRYWESQRDQEPDFIQYRVAIGFCEQVGEMVGHDISAVPYESSTTDVYSVSTLRVHGHMPTVHIDLDSIDPTHDSPLDPTT